jgi:hypothetical protein
VTLPLAAAALVPLALAWAALPFLPALAELRARRDAAPLPVRERYGTDRRAGPDALGAAARRLLSTPAAPADDLRLLRHPTPLPPEAVDDPPLVVPGPAFFADAGGTRVAAPLYVGGTHDGGPGDDDAALYAAGPVRLGPGTVVRGWLHGECDVDVGAGSVLHGSASAGGTLRLAAGCRFERLHAPCVLFEGEAGAPPEPQATPPPPFVPAGARAAGRVLVRGDLTVPDGHVVREALVVTGTLRLGARARVEGDVKARGDVVVGPGAAGAGHGVAEGDVWLEAGAEVEGAVAAEGALELGPGARVGRPGRPASAAGRRVLAAAGARVHGTLWALGEGVAAP